MSNLFDIKGKVVAITGGTGVLGSEIAKGLIEAGAKVALLDRNIEKAQELSEKLGGTDDNFIAVKTDVLVKKIIEQSIAEIIEKFGHIDVLINGAGGNHPEATTGKDQSFFDLTEKGLKFVFDLNIMGTIIPSQIIAKHFAERGEGVILNISSMAAYATITRVAAYSAAKAGVSNFTSWLAVHMAQEYSSKIRVNAIAPGFFLTHQNEFLLKDKETGGLTDRGEIIVKNTPFGDFGKPEQLNGTVQWLISNASEFVTGIVVPIDGGFNAFSGV